nr:retrotransposon protein, putative, Ty1-copia subclass [Tanacetum cinerariifolium]
MDASKRGSLPMQPNVDLRKTQRPPTPAEETDQDDLRSKTGYVFVMNGGAVDWKISKQSTTAMSSTEAEYIAASKSTMEAIWIRKFIYGLGVPTNNNLRTSSSSQSANKKQEFVKTDNKRVEKKDDEKKKDMSRVKCYNCKKEGHFAKDYKKFKVKDYEYYKTKMLPAKKDKDEQVLLAEDQAWME